jgi:hypothetical protein
MDKQPEALRLVEESENDEWIAGTKQWREEAAAELRRLHEVNQELLDFVELVSVLVIVPPMMTEQARQLMWLQDTAQAIIGRYGQKNT